MRTRPVKVQVTLSCSFVPYASPHVGSVDPEEDERPVAVRFDLLVTVPVPDIDDQRRHEAALANAVGRRLQDMMGRLAELQDPSDPRML